MTSRWAKPGELAALQALWLRVFGDGDALTGRFFSAFPPQRHTRVIAADGQIAAMASWIPVELRTGEDCIPGAYVYAVATAPERRGRGLARTLMGELERELEDVSFAALCPAEPSLYDFYGALGYETAFYHRTRQASPGERRIALTQIDVAGYGALRERYLSGPHCVWTQAALSYLQATGTRFYRFSDGCAAVARLPDGQLKISELLGPDASSDLCRALGAAEVSAPGMERAQGMLKWLISGKKTRPAYLGFAFD